MTTTHDLLSDLARMADDGCPNLPDGGRSSAHPALSPTVVRSAGPQPSLVTRFLSFLWA